MPVTSFARMTKATSFRLAGHAAARIVPLSKSVCCNYTDWPSMLFEKVIRQFGMKPGCRILKLKSGIGNKVNRHTRPILRINQAFPIEYFVHFDSSD